MADEFRVIVHGVKQAQAELTAIELRTDAATLAALKKVQTLAKSSVKSGMRGRPRWDRRGKLKGEPAVYLRRSPHHIARGGGPGSLTGHLRASVGAVRKPKKDGFGYSGGVGVGGPKSVTNFYRSHVEARYPYMVPGVKRAEPKMPVIWEKAWAKATQTRK